MYSFHYKVANSVSIIGGSDGPTSIFLAVKLNTLDWWVILVAVLLLGLSIYIIIKMVRKIKSECSKISTLKREDK